MMEQLMQTSSLQNLDEMYDTSLGYDSEAVVRTADGLTDDEKEQGKMLYKLFQGLWGLCVVQGDPGSGKDLFGNYITWKLKNIFPHKRIMRDEKPYPLYGSYTGLFNESVIYNDLKNMRAIAKGVKIAELDNVLEKAADDWVKGAGEVLLKNSILYMTEYWRYTYNREPHSALNKTIGAISKVKRHLNCLIIGTTQLLSELDKKTSKPWIDWIVSCTRSARNITYFAYFVQKVKYDKRMDTFIHIGRPTVIAFDAGKPRTGLGDGKIVVKKPDYVPENDYETNVLDILKQGVDKYEELVDILLEHSDMTEHEVLATLKSLKFTQRKRSVDFPCFFGLFNSKSAPQLHTKVRMED